MIYFVSQNLIKNPCGLYLVDIENNKNWKSQILHLTTGYLITEDARYDWQFEDCGMCFKKGFHKLNTKILNLLNKSYNIKFKNYLISPHIIRNGLYFKNKYDAIFKCSSTSSCCILLDDRQYSNDSKTQMIYGYQWDLPCLEFGSCGNYLLYSNEYGLISIGGSRRNCAFLMDFNDIINDMDIDDGTGPEYLPQPQWKSLPCMLKNRGRTSCSLINGYNGNNEKLVVINGINNDMGGDYMNDMEIYDFQTKEWNQLQDSNFTRECCGIYYDEFLQRIYIGGGVCDFNTKYAQNKMEYYDIKNQKWYILSDTIADHSYYPVMWKAIKNNKLLYIASSSSDTVELYDLRTDQTHIKQTLSDLLNTKVTKYSTSNRLFK